MSNALSYTIYGMPLPPAKFENSRNSQAVYIGRVLCYGAVIVNRPISKKISWGVFRQVILCPRGVLMVC